MSEAHGATAPQAPRVLALLALGLGPAAREGLLAVVPADLAEACGTQLLDPGILDEAPLSPGEAWLQAVARAAAGATDDAAEAENAEAAAATDASDAGDVGVAAVSALPAVLLARILVSAPAATGAAVLAALPPPMQGAVVVLAASSTPLSIARRLLPEERPCLEVLRAALGAEVWGVATSVNMLRALGSTARLRRALTATHDEDEDAAAVVQSHLFGFDDLLRLRRRELQTLLARIDNATLARALTGAGEPVTDQILGNVSDRRAALLQDEAQLYAEITEEEVEHARAEVMALVRLLYDRGQITTYFGSIRGAMMAEAPEDEDDDEEDARPGEAAGETDAAAATRPRGRLHLLLGAVAGAVALTGLVGLAGLLIGGPPQKSGHVAGTRSSRGGLSGRVLVLGQDGGAEDRAEAAPGDTEAKVDEDLAAGEDSALAGVDAVLEFPGAKGVLTRVRAEAGTQMTGVEGADEPDSAGLFLRVGRVTVHAVGATFEVGTPMAAIHPAPGSVVTVRVVLDGTTWLTVHRGEAEVRDGTGGLLASVSAGKSLRVDASGVDLSP